MVIVKHVSATVWPMLRAHIEWLITCRGSAPSDMVRSGINFSIILNSVCFLEGVLETVLRALLEDRRDLFYTGIKSFTGERGRLGQSYTRLVDDLSDRIGRATGADGYDRMFELLTGTGLKKSMDKEWEALTVLFAFRNVLGHGRRVYGQQFLGAVPEDTRDEFYGGYRIVEDYLHKQKLLDRRFLTGEGFNLMTNEIADHFWGVARDTPDIAIAAMEARERDVSLAALASIRRAQEGSALS